MTITRGSITAGGITNGGILAGGILASRTQSIYRDYVLNLDDTLDRVSGRSFSCLAPGTRYDLVNGVQTAFATNTPVITEKGIRSVGAYQNLCIQSERHDLWPYWISGTGVVPIVTKIGDLYRIDLDIGINDTSLEECIIRCNPISGSFPGNSHFYIKSATGDNYTIYFRTPHGHAHIIPINQEWVFHVCNHIAPVANAGCRFGVQGNSDTSKSASFFVKHLQSEATKYPHPYIPTTTTAVASVSESGTVVAGECTNGIFADEIANNFTLLNAALQSQGTLTLDWTPGYSAAYVTGSLNILSFDGSIDNLRYNQTVGAIELYDGANTASKAITPVANTTYTIQCTWQGSSMQVCVDGSAGTTTSFDGSFNPGSDLVYGLNNPELQYIKNPAVLKEPQWV